MMEEAATTVPLALYALTLQPPTSISQAIVGTFTATPRQQEIAVCHGQSILALYRIDTDSGVMVKICSVDTFATVRSIMAIRLIGSTKDFLLVGSDSGKLQILEYAEKENSWTVVQSCMYGKSGSRRTVPGQFLATDPKGRAVMLASLEKAKLVYVLNRDASAQLTVSSPLEAHKPNVLTLSLVGIDVGFDNPLFAALEVTYETQSVDLWYYELDLGLNHVIRKHGGQVNSTAHLLFHVPGGVNASNVPEGPSGCLICTEGAIVYRGLDGRELRVPIPTRHGKKTIISTGVMHKIKAEAFWILQSEFGDLFRLTVDHTNGKADRLTIKYFDTVPPATALVILKTGYLFVACESGNHQVYSFIRKGDEDDIGLLTSSQFENDGGVSETDSIPLTTFEARPLLNLQLVYELNSLNPIIDAKVVNKLGGDTPQIYVACGKGPRSSFRTLRHGLEVTSVSSELQAAPSNVWATKKRADDAFDQYLVLGFPTSTRVLNLSNDFEDITEASKFLADTQSIFVQQLGLSSVVQVHPNGFQHVKEDGEVTAWPAPKRTEIVCATGNQRQLALGLNNGEVWYFQVDESGDLQMFQKALQTNANILCLSMAALKEGRLTTDYLAIGCDDPTLRIVSLNTNSIFQNISMQALASAPSSICITAMADNIINRLRLTHYISIGLVTGVMLRTVLDPSSGQLIDTRTRFLGTRPVRLSQATIDGQPAVIALSSRAWLWYSHQSRLQFAPLIHKSLDYACGFSTTGNSEGLIGISGKELSLLSIPDLAERLKQDVLPLTYTPRKMVEYSQNKLFYLIETDQHTMSQDEQQKSTGISKTSKTTEDTSELPETQFGPIQSTSGHWASCIRVIDPIANSSQQQIFLENNEAAFSICIIQFPNRAGKVLCVGGGKDVTMIPRSCSSGFIKTFAIEGDGNLTLLHHTELADIPLAMCEYAQKLVIGIGAKLQLFELGQKKLLRKAECKDIPNCVVTLSAQNNRIYVGDISESVYYATYKTAENRLMAFAADTVQRWTTSITVMDHDTTAIADKFGSIAIVRLEDKMSRKIDEDVNGDGMVRQKGYMQGTANRLDLLASYYTGDLPTSIHKVSMIPGGKEIVLYTGINGSIGMLAPFLGQTDFELLSKMERSMRKLYRSVLDRSHVHYRGLYTPVKGVVDGDLCECFPSLSTQDQEAIATDMDMTVGEIMKKLDQLRVTASGF